MSDEARGVDDGPGDGPTIDTTVEIEVPPEQVWRALTEAEALASWFPLEAEVEPGEGGSIRLSWGDYFEGTARIEIWEPGRRLRTTWEMGGAEAEEPESAADPTEATTAQVESAADPAEGTTAQAESAADPTGGTTAQADGAGGRTENAAEESPTPPQQDEGRPARLAVDYLIEGRSGGTRLRLVHSGFGRGAGWNDWFEGTRRGWDFQLCCLRHWLERHPGRKRRVAWPRRRTSLPGPEAWDLLLGSRGLGLEGDGAGLAPGDPYRLETAQGDRLSGTVEIQEPPRQLALTVRELGDGLLRVTDEGLAGATELQLFLCTWDVDADEVVALEERWQRLLDGLLPAT